VVYSNTIENPGFFLFLSSSVLIELALYAPFTYLPDMMGYRGYKEQDAVWMLFIIGIFPFN
jgi:predicted MFS family arabinose efflux permease